MSARAVWKISLAVERVAQRGATGLFPARFFGDSKSDLARDFREQAEKQTGPDGNVPAPLPEMLGILNFLRNRQNQAVCCY
jgi:hypothetical protein